MHLLNRGRGIPHYVEATGARKSTHRLIVTWTHVHAWIEGTAEPR